MSPEFAPTLCFVDVETTGLDPRCHDIWEIAIVRRRPGVPDDEFVFQFVTDIEGADPEALKIGRFHERYLLGDRTWGGGRIEDGVMAERLRKADILLEVQDLLRGAYLVGAVPSFDASMLTSTLRRMEFKTTWHHRLICVETMTAAVLGWPVPRGLARSAEALGLTVDPEQAHTALGDARLARDVYDAVLRRADQ